MKDKAMSKKHDRHNSKQSGSLNSRESTRDPDSYKHILKERHYKDDEKNKRRDKDKSSDFKHSAQSEHRSKRSSSPHQSSHRKESPSKLKEVTDSSNHHRNHKHRETAVNESYEELSRRKRKLESELRALDLEEAAEKEAENKKARRSDKSRKKDVPDIKIKKEPAADDERDKRREIKKEPATDDERDKRKSSKIKHEQADIKTEKDKIKNEASKSSEDEKGWGQSQQDSKNLDKEKPNFATSGKLAEETNTYNGVVIKYNEPSEARKPKRRWRLYPFKGDSDLPFIPIHRQSAYLFGRTRLIADIPIDHPSCSKQHAVLQFRLVPYKRDDGTNGRRVRPYIIDLESSNGTFVNNKKVNARCYVELIEKDVIKFGYSSREYVLLHEESKYSEEDDDVSEAND